MLEDILIASDEPRHLCNNFSFYWDSSKQYGNRSWPWVSLIFFAKHQHLVIYWSLFSSTAQRLFFVVYKVPFSLPIFYRFREYWLWPLAPEAFFSAFCPQVNVLRLETILPWLISELRKSKDSGGLVAREKSFGWIFFFIVAHISLWT